MKAGEAPSTLTYNQNELKERLKRSIYEKQKDVLKKSYKLGGTYGKIAKLPRVLVY